MTDYTMQNKRHRKIRGKEETKIHLHLQLRNRNAPILGREMEPVPPDSVDKLRALDDDLGQVHARNGVDLGGHDINTRAEPKDEARIGPVQDQVAARQEDLAGRRDGRRRGVRGHRGSRHVCFSFPGNVVWLGI